jgi:hypothetical protein
MHRYRRSGDVTMAHHLPERYGQCMRCRALLLVVALTIAGCGATAGQRAAGDRPAGGSGSSGRSGTAPFGTVDAVGGGQIRGAELAGRDVALWFWAPW